MTRDELIDALESYASAYDLAHITDGNYWVLQSRREMTQARDAILTAFDVMHARIAELEAEMHLAHERDAELAGEWLELDSKAYYKGRIAELEQAIKLACDFLDAIQAEMGRGGAVAFMLRAILAK